VVGIAANHDGNGYWLVEADGFVVPFGTASGHGTLPGIGTHVSDIVAMTPTGDDGGYWMIGRDGGEFAFGDAKYRGSLPGLGIHVHDIVGMVATADGHGYWIVGSDGGVFAFGDATYRGSLPKIGVHVHDIVAMIPSPTREGYVLVGSDGGAFKFGSGVNFLGSLPGRGIRVSDIVGLALTPGAGGYWMAGSNAVTYAFGNAGVFGTPAGIGGHLPVVAIATAPASGGALSYAAWQVQSTPTPGSASRLNGVRCLNANDCVAVGWDQSGSVQSPLVDSWNGHTWTATIAPKKSSTVNQLAGVACPSASSCTAVGYEQTPTVADQPLVEKGFGSSWTATTLPLPPTGVSAQLTGVACPTTTSCEAVGFFRSHAGLTLAYGESWNGSVWTAKPGPFPSGAKLSQLLGVSCSNASSCIAVGNYTNASNVEVTLAAHWNGSGWSTVTPVTPGGATASSLSAVSCLANGICRAVGDFAGSGGSGTTALAEVWNGHGWSLESTPFIKGALVTTLSGVSCPTASDCTATGLYSTSSKTLAIAEQWNGSSWSLQSTPVPSGDQGAFLNDVACAVATFCTAVGQQITGSGGHFALAEQWVQHIGTATSVTSNVSPAVTGQQVNLTAHVVPLQQGFGTPTGSVTFTVTNSAGGTLSCNGGNTKSLSNGSATCTVGSGHLLVTQSPYNVKASYGGGSNFLASSGSLSPPLPVDKDGTILVVSSTKSPSVYGQRITFVATVTARSPGAGTPTGTVTFTLDGRRLCTDGQGGQCAFPLKGGKASPPSQAFLSPGTHTVVGTYSGDSNFLTSNNSSSPFHQVVDKASVSVAVSALNNPVDAGFPNTFTAVVGAVSPGAGTPFGNVTFTYTPSGGGTATGLNCDGNGGDSVPITFNSTNNRYEADCGGPNDQATIPAAGTYTITATYTGSAQYRSGSGVMTETVNTPIG
jgi:hypothetical protein